MVRATAENLRVFVYPVLTINQIGGMDKSSTASIVDLSSVCQTAISYCTMCLSATLFETILWSLQNYDRQTEVSDLLLSDFDGDDHLG